MRRNAGGHTYGDTICTVYQKVWNLHRKHLRLLLCLVEVWHKVYYIFVKICQKNLLGQFLQSCLCISHGSGAVSLNGAEVSVAVYQGFALLEILCHYNQCFINRAVPVRVVFTHGISNDTGALTIWTVVTDPKLVHIIQGSSLYRLQAIADIRKCPGNDNAHGIIYIGFLHHVRIVRGNYILLLCFHNLFSFQTRSKLKSEVLLLQNTLLYYVQTIFCFFVRKILLFRISAFLNIQFCISCMLVNKCLSWRHVASHQDLCHAGSHTGILDFHPLHSPGFRI